MRLGLPNPVAAVFGPIFQKEVRASGRRRATYIVRGLYTLGLLLLVSMAFVAVSREPVSSSVDRIQNLQELAPVITIAAMWFQFLAVVLIAPLLAAPVICDERRARSLSTLLTTPLTATQIVLGKIASRLVQVIILILLAAPVLLAVRVFGGLDGQIVLAFTTVAISIAVLAASLGLLFSIWHTRATSAAVFALLTLVLIQAGPPVVDALITYLLNEFVAGPRVYNFHFYLFASASPYALVGLTESLMTGQPAPSFPLAPFAPVWAVSMLYNLLCAALIMTISIAALRRVMARDAGEGASPVETPRKRLRSRPAPAPEPQTADSPLFQKADEPTRDRDESRTISDRPILWRELRRASIRSRRLRLAIFTLAILGIVLIEVVFGLDHRSRGFQNEGLQITMAILGSAIVMVQAVFMTTGSISTEREGRTWEVLLSTPLTGREIVLGKFLGSLRSQWFLPSLVLLHFVFAFITGAIPWFLIPQMVVVLLGPVVFFTATGQYFSLLFRKGITAAVLNLLLALSLWIGTWILLGILGWFTDLIDTHWWDQAARLPFSLNPLMVALSMTEAALDHGRNASITYGMPEGRMDAAEFHIWFLGAFAFFILSATGILAHAIARFRPLSGRSS
jgi:ABC-type transport system involved in multi-copper enzyme maturation permease subunit